METISSSAKLRQGKMREHTPLAYLARLSRCKLLVQAKNNEISPHRGKKKYYMSKGVLFYIINYII